MDSPCEECRRNQNSGDNGRSVIIGIYILPRPILGGQFAIAWIAVRDILAFVIVERPGETIAAFVQANLHRLHDIALKSIHILMRGDEQANALVIVVVHILFGSQIGK